MANRVTDAEFRVYVRDVPPDLALAAYLDMANLLVTTKMGLAPSIGEPLTKLIELNLAAHFYTLTQDRGGIIEKKVGESTEKYANASSKLGGGIGSTSFGQIVLSLTDAFDDKNNVNVKKAQFRIV